MICTIDSNQYDIPRHLLKSENHSGMVKITSGIVTEYDITRLDEITTTISWPDDWFEVQRLRLYFELPDGSISQTSPLGRKLDYLSCCWRLVWFPKSELAAVVWTELQML
jgi:hypothetical protein